MGDEQSSGSGSLPARAMGAAQALFFQYDGSRFYMSRDGKEPEFDAYQVPDETQAEWLRELIALRVSELHGERGWWSVHFLIHHGEFAYLQAVVEGEPTGSEPWERRAYMEQALAYWDQCARWNASARWIPALTEYTADELAGALGWISRQAQELLSSYRMRGQNAALTNVAGAAALRLATMARATSRS